MTDAVPDLAGWFAPAAAAAVEARWRDALAPGRHGKLPEWLAALDALPETAAGWRIESGTLVAGEAVPDPGALERTLRTLVPWRKGPLRLGGVMIDTEWRSDFKWDRIAPHVDLADQRVLDIGAGNGYFGWRMLDSGARQVVGCDPTLLFHCQFRAIEHFCGAGGNLVLPLRFEDLPVDGDFDSVFSMGVLYHRRDPAEHLQRIHAHLRHGGQAVIETLIIPGTDDDGLEPPDRYANMRNVHHLPTEIRLERWLAEAGLVDIRCVDRCTTTTDEQRPTDWMPFHSLAHAIDVSEDSTIEGHPRPLRAVVMARRRGPR